MTLKNNAKKGFQQTFSRSLYGGFVLLALYYVLVTKDFSMAFSSLGISLAFDPFDTARVWKDRPFFQKAWLVIHLGALITVGVFAFR